jgi:hypothetical protein
MCKGEGRCFQSAEKVKQRDRRHKESLKDEPNWISRVTKLYQYAKTSSINVNLAIKCVLDEKNGK